MQEGPNFLGGREVPHRGRSTLTSDLETSRPLADRGLALGGSDLDNGRGQTVTVGRERAGSEVEGRGGGVAVAFLPEAHLAAAETVALAARKPGASLFRI